MKVRAQEHDPENEGISVYAHLSKDLHSRAPSGTDEPQQRLSVAERDLFRTAFLPCHSLLFAKFSGFNRPGLVKI